MAENGHQRQSFPGYLASELEHRGTGEARTPAQPLILGPTAPQCLRDREVPCREQSPQGKTIHARGRNHIYCSSFGCLGGMVIPMNTLESLSFLTYSYSAMCTALM